MQHFLKTAARAAWTRVVSAEFFYEILITVDDLETGLNVSF
jgi:hypothetical protein